VCVCVCVCACVRACVRECVYLYSALSLRTHKALDALVSREQVRCKQTPK